MNTNDLLQRFKQNLEFPQYFDGQKEFCALLLRSCGLKWNDFRLGNKFIFFRNGKNDKLNEKLRGDSKIIINQCKKIILIRSKWRIMLIAARFYSIAKKWVVNVEKLKSGTNKKRKGSEIFSNNKKKANDNTSSRLNVKIMHNIGIEKTVKKFI